MRRRRWCGRSKAAPHAKLRAEFPHLRRFATVLWSPSYFAASVGYVWESTVGHYIEHQWDHHWDAVAS
jgi:REP element-mobilizing transposase RayT